jgi:predicted TIM-barrel fold metal-dependent hydrolase
VVTEGAPDIARLRNDIQLIAERVAPFGWHLQFYAGVGLLAALVPYLRDLGAPVVFDHMAGVLSASGFERTGFNSVLEMLADGACWVKCSGADRVTESSTAFSPAIPYLRALVAANSNRLVWGTDWPHLGHHTGPRGAGAPPAVYRDLDDVGLLDVLRTAVADEVTWRRILVDNPAELYGF